MIVQKSILLLALSSMMMVGCKNVDPKESLSEEKVEAVDSTTLISDGHNSQNSLDWAGVYQGITPCADCPGIKTVLNLRENGTYALSMIYLERPEVDELKQQGEFTWDHTGSKIYLKTQGEPMALKVGENKIWMLDGSENIIEGEIGEGYILKKRE